MKKLSLRMRMTVVTSLCLSGACIVMVLALFWLANTQVVQYIDMEIHDVASEELAKLEASLTDEYLTIDSLPLEEAEDACDQVLEQGLVNFYLVGLGILAVVVALGTFLAWAVSGWSMAPVRELCRQIDSIDARQLSTQVEEIPSGDELQKLSQSFNRLLCRLDTAFQREKRFSAAAAHELKTPLTVMKAGIDVLELSEEPTREEYRETIEDLKHQTDRLTELVMDLLAFARCRDSAAETELHLDEVVQRCLAELEAGYPAVVLEAEAMDPCTMVGKPSIVERALFNLLDNAAKFSPPGGTVQVRLSAQPQAIVFSVRDQGPGIGEAASSHIFEPFYREDASRSRRIAGAGLGLALVKEFADAYGGTVTFAPNVPRGSVFTLSIPRAPGDP